MKWPMISGVSGYKVYRSTSAKGEYTLAGTLKGSKSTTFTDSELTSGKVYHYKVCAYVEVNGVEYMGDFSSVRYGRAS